MFGGSGLHAPTSAPASRLMVHTRRGVKGLHLSSFQRTQNFENPFTRNLKFQNYVFWIFSKMKILWEMKISKFSKNRKNRKIQNFGFFDFWFFEIFQLKYLFVFLIFSQNVGCVGKVWWCRTHIWLENITPYHWGRLGQPYRRWSWITRFYRRLLKINTFLVLN